MTENAVRIFMDKIPVDDDLRGRLFEFRADEIKIPDEDLKTALGLNLPLELNPNDLNAIRDAVKTGGNTRGLIGLLNAYIKLEYGSGK